MTTGGPGARRAPACEHAWERHPPQVRYRCTKCRALAYRHGLRIKPYRCRVCKVKLATMRYWSGTVEYFACAGCAPKPPPV